MTGTNSYGIAIGCPLLPSGNEAASLNLDDVTIASPQGSYTYGIGTMNAANVKDFAITRGNIYGAQYGIYFVGNTGLTVIGTLMDFNGADFALSTEQAHLIGVESESSGMFINDSGMGGLNGNAIIIENCQWAGVAAASGPLTDTVINAGTNSLTIINSTFRNMRTSSSLPEIQTAANGFNGVYSTNFFSLGSWYVNATNYVPL